MKLESKKIRVQKSPAELCSFLSDVKNFERLMPENISKFEVINEQAFVFALKGMPEIALELKEVDAPNKVILGAMSEKIPFQLTANVIQIEETTAEAQLVFEGDFNPMMAMMVKSPISKFLETLANNLEEI
jgi:carbon monoxide dehydrogenase subunit G